MISVDAMSIFIGFELKGNTISWMDNVAKLLYKEVEEFLLACYCKFIPSVKIRNMPLFLLSCIPSNIVWNYSEKDYPMWCKMVIQNIVQQQYEINCLGTGTSI